MSRRHAVLAAALVLVTLCAPAVASANSRWAVKDAHGNKLGTAVLTNRARSEGKAKALNGNDLCTLTKVSAKTWRGDPADPSQVGGTTMVRHFSSGVHWRIRFATVPGAEWWPLRVVGTRWVLKMPGTAKTVATVSRQCPAPLAATACLWLNAP